MYPQRPGLTRQPDIPNDSWPVVRRPSRRLRGVAFSSTLVLITGLLLGTMAGAPAQAAPGDTTVISLTFDDSNADQFAAAAAMKAQGLHGTFYSNSGWIGEQDYMSLPQLQQLAADGNEIGGHTVNHPDLTQVSAEEAERQVCNDRLALTKMGFRVTSFAYPFAEENPVAQGIVKKCGYNSARGLGDLKSTPDTDPNAAGLPWAGSIPSPTPYVLAAPIQVDSKWALADLQASVTNAAGTGGWVPLTFHHILDTTDPHYDPTLSITPALFAEFVAWLKSQQDEGKVLVKTVDQVVGGTLKDAIPGPALPPPPPEGSNMIQNPGMENLAGSDPVCWSGTGFGSNQVNYSVVSPGRSGANAGHAVMVEYVDGDGKFLQTLDTGTCAPEGTPGHVYELSAWYTSTVETQFELYYRTAAGAWTYWTASPQYLPSNDWTHVTWTTPQLPEGATGISWGLNIFSNGTITTDDYSMIDVTNLTAFAAAPVPTITGQAVSGQQLTADAGAWAPAPDALAYQWNANGATIPGATASTYTPTNTEVGKTITVTVTATKDGYVTTTANSAATAAVTAAGATAFTAAPVPTITGQPISGQQLTAVAGTWDPAPDALAYQWSANDVTITGATDSTYTLTGTEIGKTITVTVTGTKAGYVSTPKTSAATAEVTAASATPFTSAPVPTITGQTVSGQQLTAVVGTWAPAPVTLTYQWNANGAAITGATASTYTLTSAEVGKTITVTVTGAKEGYLTTANTSAATAAVTAASLPFTSAPVPTITGQAISGQQLTSVAGTWTPAPDALAYQWLANNVAITGATASTYSLTGTEVGKTITVTVTGTKAGYLTTTKTSAATTAVTAAPPTALTAPVPTITGQAVTGQKLTAVAGTWAPAPVALSYQWNANGAAITGATASTYTLTTTEVGKTITVTVTGTKTGYLTTAKTSAATTAVTAAPPTALTATPVPTITGLAVAGQKLTAVAGTWAPAPVALGYQWNANGAAITGATASTYTLTSTDVGKTITVTVTGTKTGYATAAKTSAATVKVTAAPPTAFTTAPVPTITGQLVSGQKLTVVTGTWSPAPVALTRQWKRNGVSINGATGSTYTLTSTDVGKTITVTVTGTKTGYATTAKTSAATAKVTAATKAFTAAPVPKITGTLVSGQKLTVVTGTWSPGPVALTRQWKRNGVSINGATGSTYTLTSTDVGKTITVTVTGTKSGYATTAKTSAATAKVTAAPKAFTAAPVPKITGQAVPGQRLTVVTGTWGPAPVALARQWKRNGAAIKGATGGTYTLTSADAGKRITVTVTGTKSGYVTSSKTSAAVTAKSAVTRIGGVNRYAVSAAVSKSTFAPGVSIAYVASGAVYPDALSGAAAAGKTGSPVLLAATNGITKDVAAELARLKPQKIVVLGGTGTLTNNVQNALKKYSPTVTRIGGADRYAVSANVSKSVFSSGVSIAYVASGAVYPDALSGAPAAAKAGGPVLLAATNGITKDVAAELARLKPQKIVVLGGTGTLTNNVQNTLKKYSPTVTRIGGADRYAVSASVSKSAFAPGVDIVYIASGAVFPDALSGAAAAGKTGSPVLLSAPNVLPDTVKAELNRLNPKQIVMLGGTGTLSNNIQNQLDAYIG